MGSLCREAFAALCAAAIKNLASGFGRHTCAKSVTVLTNAIGWLECAFHALAPIACLDSKAAEFSNRASKRTRMRSQFNLGMFWMENSETNLGLSGARGLSDQAKLKHFRERDQ